MFNQRPIWPGDETYNATMAEAQVEYDTWVNRNKVDVVVTKPAAVVEVDEFDVEEYSGFDDFDASEFLDGLDDD